MPLLLLAKRKTKEENLNPKWKKIQSDLKKGDTKEVTLSDLARTLSQEKKYDYEKSHFTTK